MWSPEPIEVKLLSNDLEYLKRAAPHVAGVVERVRRGVVDVKDGLVVAGPSVDVRVRSADSHRFGLDAESIARSVNIALFGEQASRALEGDRVVNVRVGVDRRWVSTIERLRGLPLSAGNGSLIRLSQVADVVETLGALELHRENLQQNVAVTARLEGRDLGSAVAEIRQKLARDPELARGSVEYGGLYQQQQESFRNLLVVSFVAIVLVFSVLLIEFRLFAAALAIVFGALLALFGTVVALFVTHSSFNVISFLGAIIGIGVVAKNGILMLDLVDQLVKSGEPLLQALVQSGHRRLRPVLMTFMAGALGKLLLAYGVGSGADILRPMAIAVIGALLFSDMLSLVATPTLYYLLRRN